MAGNSFGGNIFGEMYNFSEKTVEKKVKECRDIMKSVINVDSGALRDSVEIEKKSNSSYLVGINEQKLINDERNIGHINYTPYYYYGTKPHIIRAKNGGVLHWVRNGKDYYAKSVKHPGTKPHNFIQDTLDKLR